MLGFDLVRILIIVFTFFLVETDMAFLKSVRRRFELVFVFCLFLSIFDNIVLRDVAGYEDSILFASVWGLLRVSVLAVLISIRFYSNKKAQFIIFSPLVLAAVLAFTGVDKMCIAVSFVYAVAIFYLLTTNQIISDKVMAIVFVMTYIAAYLAEVHFNEHAIIDIWVTAVAGLYYYYLVTKTYKKDQLTGLLLRHNLAFEMEDNVNKEYDLVLIDVDNFKLINDKYGHDKGDEALVLVVKTTLKHLPKGCKMYRYGGDEFIIISRKVPTDELVLALEKTNVVLSEDDYRISYGIARHSVGDESTNIISEADKAMYENKRLIKSENIWDDMTGLYNLRGFLDELNSFRKAAKKDKHSVCLVGVDVEKLSNINKAYGYTEGNLIITVLAKALRSCLRGRDFIGHLGSDEFVAALECQSEDDECIISYISELYSALDNSLELASKEYLVKINVDKYFIDYESTDPSEDHVNSLLYIKQEEKDSRRKNDLSSEDKEYNEEEAALVEDILDNNRFQYAFQPIVSAKDGSIVAYESLMRSDTEPMITPLNILKYAARSKRSYDVEKLTFFNTLAKLEAHKEIPETVRIYINAIPGHLLSEVDFALLKKKFGHLLSRMVIEITEQNEIDDESLVLLNTRREANGFNLAIDDYGSGVSNTNNLLRYMPSVVKIDRLLITGIDRNAKKQFFVNSIIHFAKENDMQTLAEGVETLSELKTVIKLGVDMIQGYVAAKPSIEIVSGIPDDIRKFIVKENMKAGEGKRLVYTVSDNREVSVVQLAMEDYSLLNVSADEIRITGSTEFSADMVVKVKDNTNCHMILSNVNLNSVDGRACIELGENTNLTLTIEGSNKLNVKGIYVPQSSSIEINGGGSLEIDAKGHECFAIGTDTQTEFGKITVKSSGLVTVNLDGEECVGIGGGIAAKDSEINLLQGTVNLNVAAVNAVGVGSYNGLVPIRIVDTDMNNEFRAAQGTVIGTLSGKQDIEIKNFDMKMTGSGSDVTVMGSMGETTGNITITSGAISSKFSGHIVRFIGGATGDVNIDISHCSISFHGEGDEIGGFGTMSEEAKLSIKECSVSVTINSASPVPVGAKEKVIKYIGPSQMFYVNGSTKDIFAYLD